MPATFAHPVFSVPFARAGLPISALVTGSLAPDFAYVLPFGSPYINHDLVGVFCFGAPVGLVAWWLFHTIVRPGLWPLAPRPWQAALSPWTRPVDLRSARVWTLALIAATVGALTHVGVDELTHDYGTFAQTWPDVWASPRLSTPVGRLPIYKILQYGFGLGGSAILALWTARAYRAGQRQGGRVAWTAQDRRHLAGIGIALAVAALGALAYGAYYGLQYEGLWRLKVFAVNTAAAGLVIVAAQALLLGAWQRWARGSA